MAVVTPGAEFLQSHHLKQAFLYEVGRHMYAVLAFMIQALNIFITEAYKTDCSPFKILH